MIVIRNITPDRTPFGVKHEYELLVNQKLIVTFEHLREPSALAQFLRDAADAVEREQNIKFEQLLEGCLTAFSIDGN